MSIEANKEAEEKLYALSNFISVNSSNVRTSKIEAMQTLYHVTRWYQKEREPKF